MLLRARRIAQAPDRPDRVAEACARSTTAAATGAAAATACARFAERSLIVSRIVYMTTPRPMTPSSLYAMKPMTGITYNAIAISPPTSVANAM